MFWVSRELISAGSRVCASVPNPTTTVPGSGLWASASPGAANKSSPARANERWRMESPQLKRFLEILEQLGAKRNQLAQLADWRALLLDAPLQHNDIIQAAAFVDMMRSMRSSP